MNRIFLQNTINDLEKELQSDRLAHSTTNKRYQTQINSVLEQLSNTNLQKEADDIDVLKRQYEDALKVISNCIYSFKDFKLLLVLSE